jgi:hypothetical protein
LPLTNPLKALIFIGLVFDLWSWRQQSSPQSHQTWFCLLPLDFAAKFNPPLGVWFTPLAPSVRTIILNPTPFSALIFPRQ